MENPGSDKAIELGCTCPVLDNGHGRGSGPFWKTVDCPLHGYATNSKPSHVPDSGNKVETIWDGGAVRNFKDGKEIE